MAHPDDESFGLGAVLDALTRHGAEVSVLCFTHGEASTLHGSVPCDLARVRAAELTAAAEVLAVRRTRLRSYPDGTLAGTAEAELADRVREVAAEVKPTHLLVFDEWGVTGHPITSTPPARPWPPCTDWARRCSAGRSQRPWRVR